MNTGSDDRIYYADAGFDHAALADERKRVDLGACRDIRAIGFCEFKTADLAAQKIVVRGQIAGGRPDVEPIFVFHYVSEKRQFTSQNFGENIVLERLVRVLRDQVEDRRFENVNACVYCIYLERLDLVGLWLFDKSLDFGPFADLNKAVPRRIIDRRQGDGRGGVF